MSPSQWESDAILTFLLALLSAAMEQLLWFWFNQLVIFSKSRGYFLAGSGISSSLRTRQWRSSWHLELRHRIISRLPIDNKSIFKASKLAEVVIGMFCLYFVLVLSTFVVCKTLQFFSGHVMGFSEPQLPILFSHFSTSCLVTNALTICDTWKGNPYRQAYN